MGHKSSNNFFAMRASPGPSLGGALPRVAREPVENRRRSVFSLNSFFVHRDMLSGEWRKAQEKGENQLGEPPDDRDFLRAVARRGARSSKGRVLQPRINDVFSAKNPGAVV